VFFGARTLLASLLVAGGVIVVVSNILAVLSGMDVRRRILTSLGSSPRWWRSAISSA